MAHRIEPCEIVKRGAERDIAFYVDPNGDCQVDDFLRQATENARARFRALSDKLASIGRITNKRQFRLESKGIWGFKLPNQERVACFLDGRVWVCTHAFEKDGKWPPSEITRAIGIRTDYLSRKKKT